MTGTSGRKLRMAMVGGGPGAGIGGVHRSAAYMDGEYELVAGAFSSDPERSRMMGGELRLAPERVYGSWREMLETESRLPADLRPDVVSIVTPNHVHYAPAKAALECGFHVVLDKPMTLTVEEALDLRDTVRATGRVFALTHAYASGAMIKLARDLIRGGRIGAVRKIAVEYSQGWLYRLIEREDGNGAAAWRTDPLLAGAGCLGDIGTHAANLSETVSGLRIVSVAADVATVVPGRAADDDFTALVRWEGGVRGSIQASQICTGEGNNLSIRVYGDEAGLRWNHNEPDVLTVMRPGEPHEIWSRNTPRVNAASPAAARAARCYAYHPEGYIEEFANIYTNVARTVRALEAGERPSALDLDFPGVDDGVRGMAFIRACLDSSRAGAAWTDVPAY